MGIRWGKGGGGAPLWAFLQVTSEESRFASEEAGKRVD